MKNRGSVLRDALRRSIVQDAGLAALLLLATWLTVGVGSSPVTIGICVVAVAVRRRWPILALAAAVVATLGQMAFAVGPVPASAAVPILIYTVASQLRPSRSLILLGTTLAVLVAWSAYVGLDGKPDGWSYEGPFAEGGSTSPADGSATPGPTDWGGVFVLGPVLVGSWALGWGIRSRRAYLSVLRARARDREAERDRQAALAVASERARITRELHDVVAHGLAVIVMQAQGGVAAFDRHPDDTLAALDNIVATGRASLAEMRHVLSASEQLDDSTHPVSGMADLPHLVERVRAAGTPVDLHLEGSPRTLPPTVDLSAYRILQEALTNTMKHAGAGAGARVEVSYAGDELRLEVRDDGTGMSEPLALGNGLRGMRERAELLGGEVTAGRAPGGGFLVHARIPLGVSALE